MGSINTLSEHFDVVIIGAGPTGLGAAKRLAQINGPSWALYDQESRPGGLSATAETPEGFLVDHGGHIIFSHYRYFDECLDEALPNEEDWKRYQRVSYVRYKDCWVPYPFQNNLAVLPLEDKIECLNGLYDAALEATTVKKPPANMNEWAIRNLGHGINEVFYKPYSFKVWAIDPALMQCKWLGERVAAPDTKKALNNVLRDRIAGNWGPNATFRFPQKGGTGGLWNAVAQTLPQKNMNYNKKVESIDEVKKILTFSDGSTVTYGRLISTMPLDVLVSKLRHKDDYMICKKLFYSGTNVIGLGIRGTLPSHIKDTCWMYFPDNNCPFYRCTIFSKYAPCNVPSPDKELKTLRLANGTAPASEKAATGPYWSLVLEVAESEYKPVDRANVVEDCIQGLINTTILSPEDEIVMTFHDFCEHGYPTPSLERDEVLDDVLPKLKQQSIYSRGRFGSWKYEVANQDHSFMLGVEAVDHMQFGSVELSLNFPDMINGRYNAERGLHTMAGK